MSQPRLASVHKLQAGDRRKEGARKLAEKAASEAALRPLTARHLAGLPADERKIVDQLLAEHPRGFSEADLQVVLTYAATAARLARSQETLRQMDAEATPVADMQRILRSTRADSMLLVTLARETGASPASRSRVPSKRDAEREQPPAADPWGQFV